MPTLPWTAAKPSKAADGLVTVMASRLELRLWRDVAPFLVGAMRIRHQMLGSPGALGVSLIARPLRRTFWTLSAWEDQAALRASTGREPHRQIVRRFHPRMVGSGFVTWTAPASALPIPWDEAMHRLEKPDTVNYHPLSRRQAAADSTRPN